MPTNNWICSHIKKFAEHFVVPQILAIIAVSAAAETSTMQAPAFRKVKVSGALNVDCVYLPDSAGTIIVNAPHSGQLPWVEVKSGGDKLHLKLAVPEGVTTAGNLPSVTVYTNYLVKAENEGDSTLRVLSTASMPEFEAKIMGNGRVSVHDLNVEEVKASAIAGHGSIVLAGNARKATYTVAGTGTIEADGLTCEEASVRSAGTGTVGVNASRKLNVKGVSGTVYYLGAPEIKKTMAIGVKVEPME